MSKHGKNLHSKASLPDKILQFLDSMTNLLSLQEATMDNTCLMQSLLTVRQDPCELSHNKAPSVLGAMTK